MITPETLFTGKNKIYLQQVPSTNAYALELIAKTTPSEGTCVFTDYQSAGRGQIGRFWHSEPGMNVLISYIFYPKTLLLRDQFYLNVLSALAVRDLVALYCDDVKIKWPNDIYVGNKKIAGILVQNTLRSNHLRASVIGIGLNVNEKSFPEDIPNPVSISQQTSMTYDLKEIISLLSSKLEYYYLKMNAGQYQLLRSQYLNAMYRKLVPANFTVGGDKAISGIIQGIDEQGRLQVLSDNIVTAYDFREIAYVI